MRTFARHEINNQRVIEVSGANHSAQLPSIKPNKVRRFSEVWPEDVGDGHIPGWYVVDGRNEIAWPHPYSMFTIIPGDADFHAEKVDLRTLSNSKVNYLTLTGNLTNVQVQASTPQSVQMEALFSVPAGVHFQYGSSIKLKQGGTFRLPFTESYGTPPGFSGDINVPLSGEKRVQNIGLYYTDEPNSHVGDGRKLKLSGTANSLDSKMAFAFMALTSRDERQLVIASEKSSSGESVLDIGNFSRLNIISDQATASQGIQSITLSLPIQTTRDKEVLYLRMRDPAVPSRIWSQISVNLTGFNGSFQTLNLELDFQDIVLAEGDRIWLDLGTAGSTEILIGDDVNEAAIYLKEIEPYRAVDAYAKKELAAAQAQYAKMYEFMPWQFTGKSVELDKPYCYGGPFDMILPALAVKKLKPHDFLSNYLVRVSSPEFRDGKAINPKSIPLITLPNPTGAPAWALYMHDFNVKRHAIADWWVNKQNPDGQLGGGWNDDVLFMSFHQADLPLDGNQNARYLIDATHKGLEATNYFKEGYCNIYPMDRMHIGDFISERYNSLVNNLGQAYAFERELESAWRLEDEAKTPINYYADGFKSSVNVFNWYWGNDIPRAPYESKSLDTLAKEFRQYTSVLDEYAMYRFTKSNVHRDDFSPHGSSNMYTYMLGGKRGTRLDAHLQLAAMWPAGGGPEVARVILHADDTSLKASAYSFDTEMRELKLRLCRIESGRYQIRIHEDRHSKGEAGQVIWAEEKDLNRFDVVQLPIPPQKSIILSLTQLEKRKRPEQLADLAIDMWDATFADRTVNCVIHNLGDGDARNILVQLFDGDSLLQEKTIDHLPAPIDFVAKRASIVFDNVPYSDNLYICIDPENEVEEILEDNNQSFVRKKGTYQIGLVPIETN